MIHCDLKPDNIMLNHQKTKVKLCDFGSVLFYNEAEQNRSEHLVSPYYRAPEVILGCEVLTGAVDIWAAGATLFELFTGKFMFAGSTN